MSAFTTPNVTLALELLKDWNFVIPWAAWGVRESVVYYRRRRIRQRIWGFSAGASVTVIDGTESRYETYALSEDGSVLEARALQLIVTELRGLGFTVVEAVPEHPSSEEAKHNLLHAGKVR